jgi:hypothetical protein
MIGLVQQLQDGWVGIHPLLSSVSCFPRSSSVLDGEEASSFQAGLCLSFLEVSVASLQD